MSKEYRGQKTDKSNNGPMVNFTRPSFSPYRDLCNMDPRNYILGRLTHYSFHLKQILLFLIIFVQIPLSKKSESINNGIYISIISPIISYNVQFFQLNIILLVKTINITLNINLDGIFVGMKLK